MTRELPVLSDYGLSFRMPEVFDHQISGTFGECQRMAYYRFGLGRTKRFGDSLALLWGKVFHACTDIWHTTKDQDAIAALIDTIPEDTGDRNGRNRQRMMELFIAWVEWDAKNPLTILRTEQAVTVRCDHGDQCPYFPDNLDGCGLTYGGRQDRIVEHNGIVGPLDIKTTVMDETDPLVAWRPDHQFMGYIWQASHLMQKHCWSIIVLRVVCNKGKMDFRYFPVSFPIDAIREWVENERTLQGRFKWLAEQFPNDEIQWAQNYARCGKPYPCEFRDVCLAPQKYGFRYKVLRDQYQERRWDFTDPDGEEVK